MPPRRDDVRHRLVPRVPDAREDRLGRRRDRPDDRFVLESRQVRPGSPTAHDGNDVAVASAESGHGPGYGGRCAGSLHGDSHMGNPEPEPRTRQLPEKVLTPLRTRAGHEPDVERHLRQGTSGVAPEQPLAFQPGEQLARCAASRPSSAVTSTSARMRLSSPLARSRSSDPRSTTTIPSASSMPCLASPCRSGAHELRQHFTLSVGTPPGTAPGEGPPPRDRPGSDRGAPSDGPTPGGSRRGPRGGGSGKGLVECAFDLLVDAADGVDPSSVLGPLPAGRGPEIRVGGPGRSFGVEDLTGSA